MEERLRQKPRDEKKYLTKLGRGLDEALGRDGRREIMRRVKGKRENVTIYRVQRQGQRSDVNHPGSDTWQSSKNGIDTASQPTKSRHVAQLKFYQNYKDTH